MSPIVAPSFSLLQMETVTLLLTSVVAYFVATWFFSYSKKNKGDPGNIPKVAGGLPFLGHAAAYGADPVKFLLECKNNYGSAFSIQMLSDTFVFVDAKYRDSFFMLPEKTLSFKEAALKSLVPDSTFGRDSIENPWHGTVIRRQFSTKNDFYVKRVEHQVNAVLKEELGIVTTVIVEDPKLLAWKIIASCSASSFLGDEICQRKEIIDVFINFNQACFSVIEMANFLPSSMLWIAAKGVKQQKALINGAVIPEINRRRELLRNAVVGKDGGDDSLPDDLLTVLAKSERTAEAIAERMMAFIFSSMVTSGGTMMHALYDLAGRQDQWDVLLKEQDSVIDQHGSDMTLPALTAMPRLHAFVWESMRLAALPIQQTRMVVKDGVELAPGLRLPAGAMVCMSGVLSSTDETVFDRPSEFMPERFLVNDGTELSPEPEKLGFFPFGIGKHYCPGRHFALAEVKGALSTMIRSYQFSTVSGKVPEYKHTPTDASRIKEPIRFVLRASD